MSTVSGILGDLQITLGSGVCGVAHPDSSNPHSASANHGFISCRQRLGQLFALFLIAFLRLLFYRPGLLLPIRFKLADLSFILLRRRGSSSGVPPERGRYQGADNDPGNVKFLFIIPAPSYRSDTHLPAGSSALYS